MADDNQTPGANGADPTRLTHGEQNISPLAQLRRMQRIIYTDCLAPETDKRERAQLALAWERLEERKRVMCGIPLPKPVDVARARGRKRVVGAEMLELPATDVSVTVTGAVTEPG